MPKSTLTSAQQRAVIERMDVMREGMPEGDPRRESWKELIKSTSTAMKAGVAVASRYALMLTAFTEANNYTPTLAKAKINAEVENRHAAKTVAQMAGMPMPKESIGPAPRETAAKETASASYGQHGWQREHAEVMAKSAFITDQAAEIIGDALSSGDEDEAEEEAIVSQASKEARRGDSGSGSKEDIELDVFPPPMEDDQEEDLLGLKAASKARKESDANAFERLNNKGLPTWVKENHVQKQPKTELSEKPSSDTADEMLGAKAAVGIGVMGLSANIGGSVAVPGILIGAVLLVVAAAAAYFKSDETESEDKNAQARNKQSQDGAEVNTSSHHC